MLMKVGCVSGCTLVLRHQYTSTKANGNRNATYQLLCSHGMLIARSGSRHFADDDFEQSNVVTQWLKQTKTSGWAPKHTVILLEFFWKSLLTNKKSLILKFHVNKLIFFCNFV
jgi:hypothetical protein